MNQADKEALFKAANEFTRYKGEMGLSEFMFEAGLAHARSGEAVAVTTVGQIEAMKNGYSRNITARDPSFVQFPDDNDVKLFTHSQVVEQTIDETLLDMKLPIAIRIGGGTFGRGVSLRTVANQLSRIDKYDQTLKDRMSKQSITREPTAPSPAVAQGDVNKELLYLAQKIIDCADARSIKDWDCLHMYLSEAAQMANKAISAINKAEVTA